MAETGNHNSVLHAPIAKRVRLNPHLSKAQFELPSKPPSRLKYFSSESTINDSGNEPTSPLLELILKNTSTSSDSNISNPSRLLSASTPPSLLAYDRHETFFGVDTDHSKLFPKGQDDSYVLLNNHALLSRESTKVNIAPIPYLERSISSMAILPYSGILSNTLFLFVCLC